VLCQAYPWLTLWLAHLDSFTDSYTDSTTDSVADSVNYPFLISLSIPSSCIYIDPLELHLQSSRLFNSLHCKAYSYEPGLPTVLHLIFTKQSICYLIPEAFWATSTTFAVSRTSSSTKRTDDRPWPTTVPTIAQTNQIKSSNVKNKVSPRR
jgi:hypothetical protein